MWVTLTLNVLIVVACGIVFANATDSQNTAMQCAVIGGAAAMVGVSNWLLFGLNWYRTVERNKWDALQLYRDKVNEANKCIADANDVKAQANRDALQLYRDKVNEANKCIADANDVKAQANRVLWESRRNAVAAALYKTRYACAVAFMESHNKWIINNIPGGLSVQDIPEYATRPIPADISEMEFPPDLSADKRP